MNDDPINDDQGINDICRACAEAAGGSIPAGHMPGWWNDRCEVCGVFQGVTAARDWRLNDEGDHARLKALRDERVAKCSDS